MVSYSHTQPAKLIRNVFLPAILLLPLPLLFIKPSMSEVITLIVVQLVLVLALLVFHSLTVTVNEESVHLRMGIGLIKTSFPLAEITNAYPVRNKWYFGWGIRLMDNGYMYNVSGLDAVELVLNSGAIHRIGTDEPDSLALAINNARQARA